MGDGADSTQDIDGEETPAQSTSHQPTFQATAASASAHTGRSGDSDRPTAAPSRPTGAGSWSRIFVSLENRDFRYLWLGMLANVGGFQMQVIARGYLAYDLSSSPLILGLVVAGSGLPMLGLSLFGGALADRMDRRRIIQAGQGLSAMVALLIAVSITVNAITWTHLLAAAVVQGVLFSFTVPARQALIPQLVGRRSLSNAVALAAAAMSGMALVAPSVAGVLYATIGPDGVYYVIVALALAGMVSTGMIRNVGDTSNHSRKPVLSDIRAGLSYIRRSPLIMTLLIIGIATTLLAMPIRFLLPVFVVEIYGRGPEALGVLSSVVGLGSLAGSLLVARLDRWRRGLLLIIGTFLSGVALLLTGLAPYYFAAIAIMLLLGLGDAARRTVNQVLIMEEVEDEYRGRVMSVWAMSFGMMPVGALAASLVAEFLGGRAAAAMLGGLLLAFAIVILISQKRLRELA